MLPCDAASRRAGSATVNSHPLVARYKGIDPLESNWAWGLSLTVLTLEDDDG
jgi:hypothetical protein